MAARIMKRAIDQPTREKIQASQLVNRLTDHILKEHYDEVMEQDHRGKWRRVKKRRDLLSPSQVTAALGLLKKVIPDLAVTTLQGDADAPLVHTVKRVIVDPARDATPVETEHYFSEPTEEAAAAEDRGGPPAVRRTVN